MLFNKRASLEISIQAIVIVVLAMTLLGLGLGFIKGMFKNISKLSESTFGKIEEQLQRDLTTSNEKLVFSQTKIAVERGKSVLLGWGIRNDGNQKIKYWVEFVPIKCPESCPILDFINNNPDNKWFTFNYKPSQTPYFVDVATPKVEKVDLNPPTDAKIGLYLIELKVHSNVDASLNDPYATADLFITVT